MKQLIMAFAVLVCTFSCKTQKSASTPEPIVQKPQTQEMQKQRVQLGDQRGPQSLEEFFEMDVNNDGLLSKAEVKGRVKDRFARIDGNGDGFISKTEFQNMKKPERSGSQRPQKN